MNKYNKIYLISRKIIIILLIFTLLFSGCKGCSKSAINKRLRTNNVKSNDEENKRNDNFSKDKNLINVVDPCVFLIFSNENINDSFFGTGFFIKEDGTCITNYHIIEKSNKWYIKLFDNTVLEVKEILKSNKDLDYVIFNVIADNKFKYLKIASDPPIPGEEIYVYGNPMGLERTMTKGIISAIRTEHYQDDMIQFDAAISPGSSGSPLLNDKGEVIGLVIGAIEDCDKCNFALNIKVIDF